MRSYRFHIFLSSFLLGVGVETIHPQSIATITWLFLISGGLAVLLLKEKVSTLHSVTFSVLCLVSFSLGLLRTEITSWSVGVSQLQEYVGQEVELSGQVISEPDIRERTQHLRVARGSDTLLVTTDRYQNVSYGDEVVVRGELSVPENFVTDLGREFDYKHYLLAQGIEYTISFAEVTVFSSGNGNVIFSSLLTLKQSLLDGIESVIGEPQAGLGAGLLLGVKQALGDELETTFRTAGIIHIVVLSGYNIMLVVAFVMFGLSFFLKRRARIVVGLVAITAFALMVGLSATVVRASVMAGLLLIAQALQRTYDVTRALFFAGAVMVCINPYLLLYDIGFQLSFMATLGLILLLPRFETTVASGTVLVTAREYLLSTIATQIAVLPLLLYYIGEVSLVSIIVNVLVLPIVPLAMLATFIAGVCALFSVTVATPFALIAHVALTYIIEIASWFASLPYAALVVPEFPAYFVFIMYGVMAGSYVYFSRPAKADELSDWMVEEEKETGGDSLHESPPVPIFFR